MKTKKMPYEFRVETDTGTLLADITAARAEVLFSNIQVAIKKPTFSESGKQRAKVSGHAVSASGKREALGKSQASINTKPEKNITVINNSKGEVTYRVQIRRRVDGKMNSICENFSSLKTAKIWRDKWPATIELAGFPRSQALAYNPTLGYSLQIGQ